MKLYKNVLTANTLSLINRELTNFLEQRDKWTCSNFLWQPNIKINISGATMISSISEGIAEMILEDLEDILPKMNHKKLQYYVWTPNSGISSHSDALYKFGATIYLNDIWDINDGGIFLYQHDGDDWRAHVPTFNTMMINDNGTLHMVTPVSPFAKNNRYTIQIFGDTSHE
jgi:hypothetical protein